MDIPDPPVREPSLGKRIVWIPVGLSCVALGVLGLALPGLPATVFFIGAAAAFSRSSPRLERWVLGLRGIGPLVRDHRAGLGMPRRAKLIALTMMTTATAVSLVSLSNTALRIVLAALWAIGTITILRIKTRAS